MRIYSEPHGKYIPMPQKVADFLAEIDVVCEQYGLGIGHEDGHGSFEIVGYDDHRLDNTASLTVEVSDGCC